MIEFTAFITDVDAQDDIGLRMEIGQLLRADFSWGVQSFDILFQNYDTQAETYETMVTVWFDEGYIVSQSHGGDIVRAVTELTNFDTPPSIRHKGTGGASCSATVEGEFPDERNKSVIRSELKRKAARQVGDLDGDLAVEECNQIRTTRWEAKTSFFVSSSVIANELTTRSCERAIRWSSDWEWFDAE